MSIADMPALPVYLFLLAGVALYFALGTAIAEWFWRRKR